MKTVLADIDLFYFLLVSESIIRDILSYNPVNKDEHCYPQVKCLLHCWIIC